jgi:hypothetical protein
MRKTRRRKMRMRSKWRRRLVFDQRASEGLEAQTKRTVWEH